MCGFTEHEQKRTFGILPIYIRTDLDKIQLIKNYNRYIIMRDMRYVQLYYDLKQRGVTKKQIINTLSYPSFVELKQIILFY